ncbi:probable WRKY transcription factor 70 [Rhodamnia argentea]|uniref:Probable WRKY transcription factor 70 n=1 Tax=Rhodamnia argentea TaxID=178133 RepID=A0A8B8PIT0_9MYRT|nr:probable WRKY transcription factor 70 [Rhodamnia argentea]
MGTFWVEGSSSTNSSKSRAIRELVDGRESAIRLKTLLCKPSGNNGSLSADELVVKILRSFTESLSALSSCEHSEVREDMSPQMVGFGSGCDDQGSEHSGESRKRPGLKDGRGCYKRRKESETFTTISSTKDDGHAWRKYGQKDILNSTFPRCYFRCTHKHDQGCRATKQVQKMEDDPKVYQITYIGNHTCREITRAPQMITDSDPWESSYPPSRNNSDTKPLINSQQSFPLCSARNSIKKEEEPALVKEDTTTTTTSDLTDNLPSFDSILPPELMGFESSDPTAMYLSCADGSPHGFLDMDPMGRLGFDGEFPFYENVLFS